MLLLFNKFIFAHTVCTYKEKNMNCDCPLPSEIPTISAVTCGENIGQIQKMIFQRRGYSFTGLNTIDLQASWDTLLSAVDDTKVTATPFRFLDSVVIPQNEAITEGGNDNTTVNGAIRVLGTGNVTVTGMLTSVPAKQVAEIRSILGCETDIVVYFVNQYNQIIGVDNSAAQDGSSITGFRIARNSGFVSDAGNEGLNTLDKAMLQFNFEKQNWRDSIIFTTPEATFDPLNDITNP